MTVASLARKQLREMGASDYLARRITQPLVPVGKVSRANLYAAQSIDRRLSELVQSPRLRRRTYETLAQLQQKLNTLLTPSTRITTTNAVAELDAMLETLDAMQANSQALADKTDRWLQQQNPRLHR